MLFNSFDFLVFFLVTFSLYFRIQPEYRWVLLLTASCYFYMFFIPVYILILFFTIIIDYFAGIWIEKTQGPRRRYFLIASLAANIGVLAVFKYFNFFIDNINDLNGVLHLWNEDLSYLPIILPIGLSFHTFQAMSYTIEVYRGHQKAERHFGIYSLYVMFYPQLVAGPIERPQNILSQFHRVNQFSYENLYSGLRMILLGLFKKVVIADRLAIVVDTVYNNPYDWHGFSLVIATVLFAFQIYCDFSGYSDIAVGTARTMGYHLIQNFRQPYFSKNISEFWTRWHISLSSWFKDYLYIPLGGNRVKLPRVYFNLLFVFVVSGLWHGANWTFIVWGLIHGILLILLMMYNKLLPDFKLPSPLAVLVTFFFVVVSWIFFRAVNISEATHILTQMFDFTDGYFALAKADLHGLPDTYLGLPLWKFLLTLSMVPVLLILDYLIYSKKYKLIYSFPVWRQWMVYYAFILSILFFGVFNSNQFIYFQF